MCTLWTCADCQRFAVLSDTHVYFVSFLVVQNKLQTKHNLNKSVEQDNKANSTHLQLSKFTIKTRIKHVQKQYCRIIPFNRLTQQTTTEQYDDWYTHSWWVRRYIWHSKEGRGLVMSTPDLSSLYQSLNPSVAGQCSNMTHNWRGNSTSSCRWNSDQILCRRSLNGGN